MVFVGAPSGLRVQDQKQLAGRTTTTPQVSRSLGVIASRAEFQFRHARFRAGHADFRAAIENASTLPRSAEGTHFETLRKLCGM